jgi:hypothetical protein
MKKVGAAKLLLFSLLFAFGLLFSLLFAFGLLFSLLFAFGLLFCLTPFFFPYPKGSAPFFITPSFFFHYAKGKKKLGVMKKVMKRVVSRGYATILQSLPAGNTLLWGPLFCLMWLPYFLQILSSFEI